MKARAFDYRSVASVPEALAAHAGCAGEARYLAGGQSLLPALNLRLDAPDLLIDIGRIEALRGIAREGRTLRIGALTRHAETLRSALVAEHAPMLTQAAAFMAHPAIRNLGTMGGSLSLSDPAAELPACMRALGAAFEITGHGGTRIVAADDFFLDLFENAIAPGELLCAIRVPLPEPGTRMRFEEIARRRGDYALVGLGAKLVLAGGTIVSARLGFCSVGPTPMRAPAAEAALTGRPLDAQAIAAARAALGDDLFPDEDDSLSAAARMHLARVLLGRVLAALSDAGAPAAIEGAAA
ncbi:FAD binding domain-containing protein [Methylobacterium planeticum]|uniref:Xanthine dehydrogenase family protein subunit M n=1 Tax=Methylobacterium planeticum TaxID=2615211 RepID=A0A6N6MT76_9HYPH|nr:xanthine dehydrogenase family protein subunit M [Methylobacterium planeticum]KAB1073480.1 xanthine dehydrogenase family protein subunit M [Methylobacterium planeticum]